MNVPRGLGDTSSPLVSAIAQAIAQMEGFNTAGTISQRQNNPGNLRSGPSQTGTASGYAVYPSAAAGWNDLYALIQKIIGYGVNLYQFFGGGNGYPGYAPAADSNSPNTYAQFVAGRLGIDPSTPLNQVDPNSMTAATPAAPAPSCDPTVDPTCTDPNAVDSSPSSESSSVPGSGTILVIGVVAVAAGWLISRLFD